MTRPNDRGLALRNAGIALAIVALAAVAGGLWWRARDAGPADGGGMPPATNAAGAPAPERTVPVEPVDAALVDPAAPRSQPFAAALARTREVWRERLEREPDFPDPLHGAAACDAVDAEFERVCRALDAAAADGGPADSCALMREVAARLASRPPALPEARDAGAWLANAFHLFRALGGERLAELGGLARVEPALVEPLALAGYRWSITRESCRGEGQPVAGLTPARVYDYAAFAFTSFGGQAYLRRRAPRLEALGCFYALSALELSIEQGHNPHGVDPRREIERCRALIEAQPFVWSDGYRRELDRIAGAWRRRAGDG